jgi:hypothetical protein
MRKELATNDWNENINREKDTQRTYKFREDIRVLLHNYL